jgi:hypothetical protein
VTNTNNNKKRAPGGQGPGGPNRAAGGGEPEGSNKAPGRGARGPQPGPCEEGQKTIFQKVAKWLVFSTFRKTLKNLRFRHVLQLGVTPFLGPY